MIITDEHIEKTIRMMYSEVQIQKAKKVVETYLMERDGQLDSKTIQFIDAHESMHIQYLELRNKKLCNSICHF
jgi:hypothetical protein